MDWDKLRQLEQKWGAFEDEYKLIYTLVGMKKPDKIMEFGCASGTSTIVIASAIKDYGFNCKLHSIEIDGACCELAQKNINDWGLSEYVEIHHGKSYEIGAEIKAPFVFIDGDHTREGAKKDLDCVLPFAQTIIIHDTAGIAKDWEAMYLVYDLLGLPEWTVVNFRSGKSNMYSGGECKYKNTLQGIALAEKSRLI